MTQEVLEQANVLKKEIDRLEEHVQLVQKSINTRGCNLKLAAIECGDRNLFPKYLPASLEVFVSMYIANAGARVIELKQQLANLK